ncbi:MAG: hypothetical protein ACD_70C00114G0006 [uncultured bacterium]|nr:MAG: hypothetical protein ACD_70C00114G0006 [uncultured bacterium]OGT25541.1 MAG: hypothetical protein A3B71_05760 [Gammaproteobacteria bacterium RIFCSPHIGHO2_02_FULL_42_43]OGT51495.1 MAG: hypothetical protein A3E54_05525 [Gammaproteobacteria bacterium RIFCSPHIGHO2_12_FULL_41_25]OGT62196.1 MAG: hypothetical protein A3I77_04460 [Gammaproteobacteria bacterium RIFCSPLOWO2_02_FULL_42_14]OGT85869.1 MAG: hypothetical protein A3G86_04150 [Gammaproteobacteria bacterium RIFCSPLOWO2_12_FULL_42_18]
MPRNGVATKKPAAKKAKAKPRAAAVKKPSTKNTLKKIQPRLSLISKKVPKLLIPYAIGPSSETFQEEMETLTRKRPPPLKITKIKNQEITHAETPRGSEAVCTPTKVTAVEVTTPKGKHKWQERLHLFARKKYYTATQPSPLLKKLDQDPGVPIEMLSVTITPQTIKNQPDRRTQKPERRVIGNSANELVTNFLKSRGFGFPEEKVKQEKWELCHLLSYVIAKNAVDSKGRPFDTQIIENLFAGTRVLNENMMRLEFVLLTLLRSNEIHSLQFCAKPIALRNAHILKMLTLTMVITTHHRATLKFPFHFHALKESRIYPRRDLPTCYAAFFRAIIKNSITPPKSNNLKSTC